MKFLQTLAPVAGLISLAHATGTDASTIYTTVVTTAYETYCPSPTTFIHHNVTYTATTATTLTITNCPCTITTHKPPPYTTTKTYWPPPPVNTTSCPPELSTTLQTTIKTPKPPKPTYHNTTIIEHTPKPPKPTETPTQEPPKPPKPSHHPNVTSTTVIIVTPPAVTSLAGVTPVTSSTPPSKTPVAPTASRPATVETGAADKVGAGIGAVLIAGFVALLI